MARDICEAVADEQGCAATLSPSGYRCQWVNVRRVLRDGDTCEITPIARCLAFEDHGVPPACVAHIPGCDPAVDPQADIMPMPVYRELGPGEYEMFDQCGNPQIVGFESCSSGAASEADPPACACVCELV